MGLECAEDIACYAVLRFVEFDIGKALLKLLPWRRYPAEIVDNLWGSGTFRYALGNSVCQRLCLRPIKIAYDVVPHYERNERLCKALLVVLGKVTTCGDRERKKPGVRPHR